jgi:hypothetical protein
MANPNPATFNPEIAYITAADGSIFQVLNADGTDWDMDATAAAYYAYMATLAPPH